MIYAERLLNYSWQDDALDELLAVSGYNSSIGFCQIKLKTAYWIEKNLHDERSPYYLGKGVAERFPVSRYTDDLIAELKDDRTNIHYAAVYLAMFQHRWKRAGFPISMKPEILATLYSTGPYHTDGSEGSPNPNPRYNSFGRRVKQLYESDLLNLHFSEVSLGMPREPTPAESVAFDKRKGLEKSLTFRLGLVRLAVRSVTSGGGHWAAGRCHMCKRNFTFANAIWLDFSGKIAIFDVTRWRSESTEGTFRHGMSMPREGQMNERMVEILVYILRELRDKPRGIRNLDLVSKDLVRQGYTENEINSAFSWLFDRIQNNFVGVMKHTEAARDQSHRFFREMEKRVITPAAYGYLIQIHELGLIDDLEMEQVLERILMLDRGPVTVDDMKSLVAEMLFGPANQRFRSYFILDDKERRVH